MATTKLHGFQIALLTAAVCGTLLSAGCSRSAAAGTVDLNRAPDYLPLRPGMSWIYRVSDDKGRSANRVVLVEGPALWDSGSAGTVFRVRWDLLDGSVLSWERRTADGVGCLQEETRDASGTVTMEEEYEPAETVVDERPARLVAGVAWSETFMDTTPNYHGHPRTRTASAKWLVETTNDRVTVPAGTFTCIRVRRTRKHRPPAVFWFAKGVGLVKELGAGPLGNETLALVQPASRSGSATNVPLQP